ncbi:MAG: oxygenase MpaB family protein [Rhodobacteraceae bacterium]|nr:oxygenase MpaB family protein [Paracoccaceae bacterium]
MTDTDIPIVYRDGYRKASAVNPEFAQAYIELTRTDDPPADAVVALLASLDGSEVERFMNAGMAGDRATLSGAPQELRDFFETLRQVPVWYDRNVVVPGQAAFCAHLDLFAAGLVTVTLRNFNSLMSRIFYMTGQFTTRKGLLLIRSNTRFLVEMMMFPGGLEPGREGWKFAVRIRLVHARIRRQLRKSGKWDESAYGTPVSAANMALASANFSAAMIRDVQSLGAELNDESRAALMQIWRYASWVMGTPEKLLFGGNEAQTVELARIGHLCEPPPDGISAVITNATVHALPEVAKLTEAGAKRGMVEKTYLLSRALLGDELADQYGFPLPKAGRATSAVAGPLHCNPFIHLLRAASVGDLCRRLPEVELIPMRLRQALEG